MSIILKERLMADDNYLVAEFLHQALGELLAASLLQTSQKFRNKNQQTLTFATSVYEEYLRRVGDASDQFKRKLN